MEIRFDVDDQFYDQIRLVKILQKHVDVHKDQAFRNGSDIDWSDFPEYQRLCRLYAKVRQRLADEVCRAVGIAVN